MRKSFLVSDLTYQEKYDKFVKDELGFNSSSKFSFDFSTCNISVYKTRDEIPITRVNSSACVQNLKHESITEPSKRSLILVNSLSQMFISSSDIKNNTISKGESILLPSWQCFSEHFTGMRDTVSVSFNLNDVVDNKYHDAIDDILFTNGISLWEHGCAINRIVHKLYLEHSDSMQERIISALKGTLSLQIEEYFENKLGGKEDYKQIDWKLADIMSKIDENVTINEFCLSKLADIIGVTTRCIQYKLAESGLTFNEIIKRKRCALFRERLLTESVYSVEYEAYSSGFPSFAAANRAFISVYGLSPKKFKALQRK